jgi:error-prone DNA polymerase
MTESYVEFHARSAFSFLEGASLPEALVQQAANLGMPALGILDRDGLYGAPRLYTTAKKLGLRSHVGAEVSVNDLGLQTQPAQWQPHSIPERPVRLSLLCESQKPLATHYGLQTQTEDEGGRSRNTSRDQGT